jgi:hypothetical protein
MRDKSSRYVEFGVRIMACVPIGVSCIARISYNLCYPF